MAAVLTLMVRWLASDGWGRAMLAELAAIDDPRARRRFARGCVGASLRRPATWLRFGALGLVGTIVVLLFTGPGDGGDTSGLVIVGVVLAISLLGIACIEDLSPVAPVAGAAGLAWWAGVLSSATVRSHPEWALALLVACVAIAAWRGGALVALGTALVSSLLIFTVAVGTYTALPRLAPNVVPANARNPVMENQIESTDPYVGELLLAGLFGLAVIGAAGSAKALGLDRGRR
jgi:hypothetical protein